MPETPILHNWQLPSPPLLHQPAPNQLHLGQGVDGRAIWWIYLCIALKWQFQKSGGETCMREKTMDL